MFYWDYRNFTHQLFDQNPPADRGSFLRRGALLLLAALLGAVSFGGLASCTSFGNFAMSAAMRRTSSLVSRFAADRRPGSSWK